MGIDKGKDDKPPFLIETEDDETYQAMLAAIEDGSEALNARPRMDMAGAVAIPQQRDFGKLY